MTTELMTRPAQGQAPDARAIEQVLVGGDLSKLTSEQRLSYYKSVCDSLGLNPLTRPFEFIVLSGKLTLYARKDAAEQLRDKHGVSITELQYQYADDLVIVTATARDSAGRVDSDVGAVVIGALRGEARANAVKKAVTQAKRRVTLSICGLGMLDETEVEQIQVETQLDTQRAELEALLDQFPDARAALKGRIISDARVPEAIAKLRARQIALPEAPPKVDPAEAVDLTIPERIEQTTAMARAKIEEIGRRKGGITNGDLPTLKTFLRELQVCDPRMDDADPQTMSGKALLAALMVRVATPEEAKVLAAAPSVSLITDDEPPF